MAKSSFSELRTSPDKMYQKMVEDRDFFRAIGEKIIERIFTVGDAELSRRVLRHWIKADLLPYQEEETIGWRKFSLIEFAWLKAMQKMRSLGISIEKIKKLKNELFDFDLTLLDKLESATALKFSSESPVTTAMKNIIATLKEEIKDEESWKRFKEDIQLSTFSCLISTVVLYDAHICFVINESGSMVLELSSVYPENKSVNEEKIASLSEDSFILINIRKIIHDIFKNNSASFDSGYMIAMMNPKEKNILDHIRSGGFSELLFRFNDTNEVTHIEVKRKKISKEVLNKVSRFLKRGDFQGISFRTRDGQLINYEETDIIKIK